MNKIKEVWVVGDRMGCELNIGDKVEVCGQAPWYKSEGYGIIKAMGTENFSWAKAEDWQLFAADPFNPTVKMLNDGKEIKCHSSFLWKKYGVKRTIWNLFGLRIRTFYQTRQHSLWWVKPDRFLELGQKDEISA